MQTNSLDLRLENLLSESLEEIRQRQEQTLQQLIGRIDQPIALFGASHLGRKVLSMLKGIGVTPCAFLDNNPGLWGKSIDSVPIYSPEQLVENWKGGDLPAVICTIWSGHLHDRMPDRLKPLRELGFERIALFGHLAWRFPQHFLPHYCIDLPEKVLPEVDQIRRAYSLLSDNASRQLFVNHVDWRLHLNYDLLPGSSPFPIYFDTHFSTDSPEEVVFDLGAFNGDTAEGYLATGRRFRTIHCFEPVASNFAALQERLGRLEVPNIYAHRLAVGDSCGEVLIEAANGPSSRVGLGNERVSMTTLDDLASQGIVPTFIKIDIEGFEPQCLAGGRQLIRQHQPVIAVSVYHEQNHLWRILLQLHSYYDGYRFSLCPHVSDGWDLVLYAVPPERVPQHLPNE